MRPNRAWKVFTGPSGLYWLWKEEVCLVWSGGATRWDFGVFEVFLAFVETWTVGLGVFAVSRVFEDWGSLTDMRCAVVSRRSGIIL